MAFKEELTQLLSRPESGIEAPQFDLEETPNGKVGGFLISRTFADKPQIQRQNMVWDYLDSALKPEQICQIVSLVTITPDEASAE